MTRRPAQPPRGRCSVPNRLLYERICVSETIADLSVAAERFFYRLIVKVDDFGRFHARPSILRGNLFPLILDQITDADVQEWLSELAAANLVRVYEVEGREYLCVSTWDAYQRRRATTSKFPAPPCADIRVHPHADDSHSRPLPGTRYPVFDSRNSEVDIRKPEPVRASDDDAPAAAASAAAKGPDEAVVPAALAGFHEVLSGVQGYTPSAAFLRQVSERYGALDLTEEALKIVSWLADDSRNRGKRAASTRFVLNWLKKSLEDAPASERTDHQPDAGGSAPGESLAPPTEADAALWADARGRVSQSMNAVNWETYIAPLAPLGRAADGGMHLRAPPGRGAQMQRFRQTIARSLFEAGDPEPERVVIVEARPGQE